MILLEQHVSPQLPRMSREATQPGTPTDMTILTTRPIVRPEPARNYECGREFAQFRLINLLAWLSCRHLKRYKVPVGPAMCSGMLERRYYGDGITDLREELPDLLCVYSTGAFSMC